MKVVIARPAELGEPELARWRSFQAADPAQDSPFLSPEFTLAVGAFRRNVRIAVISEGSDIVGFFPYQRHVFGVGRPVGTGFSDRQGVIHAKDVRLDGRELLRACDLAVWRFDHLVPDQPVAPPCRTEVFTSPIIDLTAGFQAYVDTIRLRSSSTLRGIHYKRRRLEREVGPVRHVLHSTDPSALRTLLTWKSAQYTRTGRVDLFAKPGMTEFITRLHQTKSDRFSGSLSLLHAGDRLIAGHFGMYTPTTLVLWFPVYDTAFGKYSPGLIQMLAMSSDAADIGIRTFDLGRSRHDYKNQLKTGHLLVSEGWAARPSIGAAVHRVTVAPREDLRSFIRARPEMREKAIAVRERSRALRTRFRLLL